MIGLKRKGLKSSEINNIVKSVKLIFNSSNSIDINIKNLSTRLSLRKNKNRYDNFKIDFYKKVQKGFLKLSKKNKNYVIVDSNKNLIHNKKKVLNNILKLINK